MEETDTLPSLTPPSTAICEWQSMMPGITYWLAASIFTASAGTMTFSPASTILPSRMTIEPMKLPLVTVNT